MTGWLKLELAQICISDKYFTIKLNTNTSPLYSIHITQSSLNLMQIKQDNKPTF